MKFFIILSLSVLLGYINADEASLRQTIKNENELIENVKTELKNGDKKILDTADSKIESLSTPLLKKLKSLIDGKFKTSQGQRVLKYTADFYKFSIYRAFEEIIKIFRGKSEIYTSYLKYDEFVKNKFKKIINETVKFKTDEQACKIEEAFVQFVTNAEKIVKRISKCALDSFSSISLEPEGVNVIVSSIEEITKNINSQVDKCNKENEFCLLRVFYNSAKSFSILWVKLDYFTFPYAALATKKQDTEKCIINEMESFYDSVKDAHLKCRTK